MAIRLNNIQQLSRKLKELAEPADRGDFRDASEIRDYNSETLRRLFSTVARTAGGSSLAAGLAEFYFYFGDDESAKKLLEPYAKMEDTFLSFEIQPRYQLQLAEYYLCQRRFEKAEEIASRILNTCLDKKAHLAVAECCYYLLRCYTRMNRHNRLEEVRDLALSSLGKTDPKRNFHKIRWRMGLVLLADGFGQWRAGRPMKGEADLYAANWLLHQTDQRAVGSVQQVLGNILRACSSSPADYVLSLSKLESAKRTYESMGHDFFLARVLTDIARTHIRMSSWRDARNNLDAALEIVRKQLNRTDPARRHRQEAEIFLWRGALAEQEATSESKQHLLKDAEADLLQAYSLAADANSRWLLAEVNIILGHVRLKQNRADARDALERALDIATQNDFVKLKINAHLSMAEYYAAFHSVPDLRSAVHHLRMAKQLTDPYISQYLKEKLASVEALLSRQENSYFLLTADQLGKGETRGGPGTGRFLLKDAIRDFRMWCVQTVLERCNNNLKEAAIQLGVTETALRRYSPIKPGNSSYKKEVDEDMPRGSAA